VTKRLSHGLDAQYVFTWAKELQEGTEINTVNDVFNRSQNKTLSGFSRPLVSAISVNYRLPAWGSNKILSQVVHDWTIGSLLSYSSGLPILAPTSTNNLNTLLFRSTFFNRNPGVPLFLKDLNCHCIDPTTDLVLNPNAWSNPAAGQWGAAAPYYNDYRYERRPAEIDEPRPRLRNPRADEADSPDELRKYFQPTGNVKSSRDGSHGANHEEHHYGPAHRRVRFYQLRWRQHVRSSPPGDARDAILVLTKHLPHQDSRAGEESRQCLVFAIPAVERPSERLAGRNRTHPRQQSRHAPCVVTEIGKEPAEVLLFQFHYWQIHQQKHRREKQPESPFARRDGESRGRGERAEI
jgi:hypothetical protein